MLRREKALECLNRQKDLIKEIAMGPRFSTAFKKWQRDTEVAIEKSFGDGTRHLKDFQDVNYHLSFSTDRTPDSRYHEKFLAGLQDAAGVLQSLIEEIQNYWEEDEGKGRIPSTTGRVERICDRFHLMARTLRARYQDRETIRIEDEYDVQDLVHSILKLDFDDVRKEEWTPSYAGGSARMDFLLKNEGIVLEIKRTRKTLGTREVGDQLLIDIARYRHHPDCKLLICFVYDPEGIIGNPSSLESDLSKAHDGMGVRVVVAPKGL